MSQIPERLKTGLPLVDHEHQTLLDLLQRTRNVCAERPSTDCHACSAERARHCFAAFERILNEGINFMLEHFEHEERLFDRRVPKLHAERHRTAHGDIANAVLRVTTYLDSRDTAAVSHRLGQMFEDWLIRHIEEYDLELARHLQPPAPPPRPSPQDSPAARS